jgi:dTDP-3-amino-2,3,6-trideoxy-4-keto-D-glucose/dTDP-3-amino-3,4,6-trideoxy-alpha-D-glucose/dTDP-2,6-dideoxy-D-kanosamine transaminase
VRGRRATVPVNDLARGVSAHRPELVSAVERVLDSGRFVLGPEVDQFEAEFAQYLGTTHCVGLGNGTDALEIALTALGCQPGDVVLTVANAGGYTSSACRKLGLRCVYVDVRSDNLLVDQAKLVEEIKSKPKVVVVTHLYGAMADVAQISALCRAEGVPLVEDCAQAAGALTDGRAAGSWGDLATFSFYPTKNLGAIGDGGAIVTSDDRIAAAARSLRQYGWGAKYDVRLAGGRNSRLDEMQAAILRVRLTHLDEGNRRRRLIHAAYSDCLPPNAGRFVHAGDADFVAHLAVLVTPERDSLRAQLRAAEVSTDIHYPVPDHRQAVVRDEYAAIDLPVTERSANDVLTVPCFAELTDVEVAQVCDALADVRI